MSSARPVDSMGNILVCTDDPDKPSIWSIDHRLINDPDTGTKALVNTYLGTVTSSEIEQWPNNHSEWLSAQLLDPFASTLLSRLPDEHSRIPTRSPYYTDEFVTRARYSDGSLGPALVAHKEEHTSICANERVTISRTVIRIIVPAKLIPNCLWRFHQKLGHPGRQRTMATINLKYYVPGLYAHCKRHCHGCHKPTS